MEHHADAYFLSYGDAYEVARHQHRVSLGHPYITGLQICYYAGDPVDSDLRNLVNVPIESFYSFFLTTRLRLPTRLVIPPSFSRDQAAEMEAIISSVCSRVMESRLQQFKEDEATILALPEPMDRPERPRFYIPANRLTTVMQYASMGVARALEARGAEVMYVCETDDLEALDLSHHTRALLEFSPDAVFTINSANEYPTAPHMHRFVWWQDLMAQLQRGDPIEVRDRDVHFSAVARFDHYLRECGVPRVERQMFCVDPTQFKPGFAVARESKIVFVGSAYEGRVTSQADLNATVMIREALEVGQDVTDDLLVQIAESLGLNFQHVFQNLFHAVVRQTVVEWMCMESPIPVEVYGFGWESVDLVKEFYKGDVAHDQIPKLYQGASHALVVHPFELNSQRLAEVSAAGSRPLVFDCRHSSESPHWENSVLYFKTRQQLADVIRSTVPLNVTEIASYFSYDRFAARLIETVQAA